MFNKKLKERLSSLEDVLGLVYHAKEGSDGDYTRHVHEGNYSLEARLRKLEALNKNK